MTTRAQWYLVGAIVLLLGTGLFALTHYQAGKLPAVAVGSEAPAFEAVTLDASPERRRLEDYHGRLILLNVWATWCLPCRDEMPSIQRLYDEYRDQGLAVVAVSVDDPGADDDIREFVQEFGLTFDILHDPQGSIMQGYQLTGVPESFLIDANGRIRRKAFATDWFSENNRAVVEALLPTD